MRPFDCGVCGQFVFFDNDRCLSCESPLGYVPAERAVVVVDPSFHRRCFNAEVAGCNWLLEGDDTAELCLSCRLTSVRPPDDDGNAMQRFRDAEDAKRRLVDQLLGLRLPLIERTDDPVRGVTFELLSSRDRKVITGHQGGVITLDLSESDDAHREFVRLQLGEAYRTVLGHLRHEIGHYYWDRLVDEGGNLDGFRQLFGDETISYDDARQQHYDRPSDFDYSTEYVSNYATMHPWEDWAETFAHYLHIRAGLETSDSFGLRTAEPATTAAERSALADQLSLGPLLREWLAISFILNGVSRSIGQDDLYPFVLAPIVAEKLDFVHRLVVNADDGSL